MKKIIGFVLLVFISLNTNAQFFNKKIRGNGTIKTETRKISNFSVLSVAGPFDVELFKSDSNEITIKGDENVLEYIVTEVVHDKLKIYFEEGYNVRTNKTIKITVPFTTIEGVALAGSGDIFCDDVINTNEMKTSIAGSGDITLAISASNLKSSIAGSGNINVKGDVEKIDCSIAGSGDVNANQLNAKIAKISIAGSGDVKINVSEEIHVSSVGSGDVYYSGNPKIVKSSSMGSGDVIEKN